MPMRLANAKTKLAIDRYLALPLVWFIAPWVWLLGKVLRRNHSQQRSLVKVIVVAKYLGFGSIIQAMPMLASLRRAYPAATLLLLTTNKNASIAALVPSVDRALCVRDDTFTHIVVDCVRLMLALWRLKVDLYFDLEVYSATSTLLSVLSLARNRCGFYRRFSSFRLLIYTHLIFFNARSHISETYNQLAKTCGCDQEPSPPHTPLVLPAGESDPWPPAVQGLRDPGDRFLVIGPSCSDLMLERRWPLECWQEMLDHLGRGYPGRLVVVGGAQDRPYIATLLARMDPAIREKTSNLAGDTSLPVLATMLRRAELAITVDSGPAHLAANLGVPTIVLFGPVSPEQYLPLGPRAYPIYARVYCSPCLYLADSPPCGGNNVCMQKISVRQVLSKVEDILAIDLESPEADATNPDRPWIPGHINRLSWTSQWCPVCGDVDIHRRVFQLTERVSVVKCEACRLESLHPRPTDQELAGLYDERYFDAWDLQANTEGVRAMKRRTFDLLLDKLPDKRSKSRRILDCGCATGFLAELAKERGYEAHGIEVNPFAVEQARKTLGTPFVLQGGFVETELPENSFAGVFMADCLEHMPDLGAAVGKAWRLLEPGGRLIITTPDTSSLSRRLLGPWWPAYKLEHVYYLNRCNVSRLLEHGGFELVEISRMRKYLTIDYLHAVCAKYRRPLVSPGLGALRCVLPKRLRNAAILTPSGDMLVVAQKPPSATDIPGVAPKGAC
jgi:ADP-heptose:LPS heptosyltransferase/SAM-dependent methyltransferase